jgi:hypothetical protein
MKDIVRQYPLLTADERFRLFVEALGRKDEQELDRLEATCPRKTYTAQDYEYTRRKVRFFQLAYMTAVLNLRNDVLVMLTMAVGLASGTSGEEGETTLDEAAEAFQKLMLVRHGKRAGWLRFCEHLGVNPDAMTAPLTEHVEWAMDIAEHVSETLGKDDSDGVGIAERIAARELEALNDAWGDAL